jgi:MSHA biogenesis protein MshQ
MYTSCENPNTCAAGQQIDFTNNSNTTVLNAENQSATPTWQSVTTFFNADSTALFDVNSDDVGVHTHHFRYQLNGAGSTANETLQTSIDYYARPHDIVISSRTNLDGDELDTSNTAKAQEDFYVYLQGVDSSGAAYPSYNDVDMVPGGVTDHHSVTWNTHTLVTPIAGTPELGILTQSNLAAIDTRLRSTMNFSELSRISVGGVVNDYWGVLPAGDFNYTLDEITIGDFVPAYIQVSQIANPTWSSLTSNKYQGFSSTITGAEFEVRAYGNNDVVLLNYDNTEPTYDNPPATDNPLLKAPSQASIGGTLESDLIWTLTDVVPTDNDHINLLATFENVVWNKRAGLPTADDVQPNITQFEIPLTFFTDTNGTSGTSDDICVKTAASAACDTSTIQLPLTNPQILNYARASIPEQVDASANNARIPVQLEVLTGVTNVSGSDDIYDFTLHNAESLMDNAVISGLDHSGGACTIGSDCIAIANSADGSLRNIADDSSNLTQGEGTLSISSGADLSGILEAELTLPDSLHWFWDDVDGDGNLDLIAPSTFIIFGDYQGKAPILFIQPGFR